jgi:hypothetical protein
MAPIPRTGVGFSDGEAMVSRSHSMMVEMIADAVADRSRLALKLGRLGRLEKACEAIDLSIKARTCPGLR